MAYCTLADIVARMPRSEILDCLYDPRTDGADRSLENPAVAAKLAACIARGDTIIDGYLRARCRVPVSPVPALIVEISANLAHYHLVQRRLGTEMPESLEALYRHQIEVLKGIQRGEIDPGVASPVTDPVIGGPWRVNKGDADRIFTREVLDEW